MNNTDLKELMFIAFEEFPIAIFWFDENADIFYVNAFACKRYGYSQKQLLKMSIFDINPNVNKEMWNNHWQSKLVDSSIFESSHVDLLGKEFPVDITDTFVDYKGKVFSCTIINDITNRKRKESTLRGALMELRELKEKLEEENNYLHSEIKSFNIEGIITVSDSYNTVLEQIEKVSPTDSYVMIIGELGTGKNLLARTIHDLSNRRHKPFIRVDCSVLDEIELESELFGHVKGAFKGAKRNKLGKFHLANGGTLLLDHLDQTTVKLQKKIRDALMTSSFHAMGSNLIKQSDARIITTVSEKIESLVEKNIFLDSLFYTLNVFSIRNIPLRDRREDIPVLARYFTKKISLRLGKRINSISKKTIAKLSDYHYPGNVKELESIIERGVIMSENWKLTIGDWFNPKSQWTKGNFLTLDELQYEHILRVLNHTNWKISGINSASQFLDIKSTTLKSRMEKLGIKR